jgi:hypothetical protein
VSTPQQQEGGYVPDKPAGWGDQKQPAITTQSEAAKGEMQFRVFDWRRIRRDIKRLHPSWASAWFSAATLLLGIGAGAGLSLLSLYNGVSSTVAGKSHPAHPKTWVLVTHIGIAAACFVGFVLCTTIGVVEYVRYKRRKNELDRELDIFEATFEWVPTQTGDDGQKVAAAFAEGVTVDEARRRRRQAEQQ